MSIILEPIANQPFKFDAISLGFMGATMTSTFWITHHHLQFVERGSQWFQIWCQHNNLLVILYFNRWHLRTMVLLWVDHTPTSRCNNLQICKKEQGRMWNCVLASCKFDLASFKTYLDYNKWIQSMETWLFVWLSTTWYLKMKGITTLNHYLINKCKTIVAWNYFPNLHGRH